jgi:hypothetical protein
MTFNDDFPVPLGVYAKKIARTHDEVWLKLLQAEHGSERHSEAGWHKFIEAYNGDLPAPQPPSPQLGLPLEAPRS